MTKLVKLGAFVALEHNITVSNNIDITEFLHDLAYFLDENEELLVDNKSEISLAELRSTMNNAERECKAAMNANSREAEWLRGIIDDL